MISVTIGSSFSRQADKNFDETNECNNLAVNQEKRNALLNETVMLTVHANLQH